VYGFNTDGQFVAATGKVRTITSESIGIALFSSSMKGISGGPVVDQNSLVVGVVHGATEGLYNCITAAVIERFIRGEK
jgi:hypothetical protein